MYSTKTATTNNVEFNSSYMPVGINENVFLKSVTVEKSPQGKDFIRFTFENENKQTAEFTEWKNEKNMWIKTDEDLQNRDNQQFGRILQLVNCYYDNTPEFEGSSFAEMINWVKNTLAQGVANDNKPLRVKVIYDNKGYTRVSSNGIYVESMTVAKEQSQIKLFKRDLMERPITADVETNDPLANVTISTPDTETDNKVFPDDLPF